MDAVSGSRFHADIGDECRPEWNSDGIAWKTPLPGRGASSPVVFNDHIYLTAFTGYAIDRREPGDPSKLVRHLLCFDVNTGEQLWQQSVPAILLRSDRFLYRMKPASTAFTTHRGKLAAKQLRPLTRPGDRCKNINVPNGSEMPSLGSMPLGTLLRTRLSYDHGLVFTPHVPTRPSHS